MSRTFHGFLAGFILLLLCGSALAVEPRVKKSRSDSERLQGTWLADLEPGLQGRLELRDSGLHYVHIRDNREKVIWDGHFSVNEQSEPKQMDWTPLRRNKQSPPANLAIYHLIGDVLLVIGDTEGPRPTAFYSGGGDQRPKTILFRRSPKNADSASD